ncbi:hypothetical protein DSO57_1034022 [Entomophthora muscae]|uniref:Uncharacterized protein n=1 Tax=Entomophthora muscae TaxID=34485 RepID=A0ACC2SCX2_9FUNG|nr:hypothetical protein DSO57_1034022 [Entomophthora muscae]
MSLYTSSALLPPATLQPAICQLHGQSPGLCELRASCSHPFQLRSYRPSSSTKGNPGVPKLGKLPIQESQNVIFLQLPLFPEGS